MGIGKRRVSNYGMLQNYLRGLAGMYAPTGAAKPAPRVPVATLASRAGTLAVSAAPMDNARRAESYRQQRGGLAPVLTDRQRRRLRKRATASALVELSRLAEQTR